MKLTTLLFLTSALIFSACSDDDVTTVENDATTADQTILSDSGVADQQDDVAQNDSDVTSDADVQDDQSASDSSQADLTDEEKEDLAFLREEEKLARDVYLTLYGKWPSLMPLSNIAQSEQSHMDEVKKILDAYNLPDSMQSNDIGSFSNPDLLKLYNDLVTQGSASEVDALIVGATVEDLDINDIDHMITRTSKQDILTMYEMLNCGSRNHLRSFTSNITNRGGSYSPQYISQARYDAILGSAHEQCF